MRNNIDGRVVTAVGAQAMRNNTSGQSSVAIGVSAMQENTTGDRNTAVGTIALLTNTTGDENTAIGYGADVTLNNLSNATAIGANALVRQSNSVVLGNNADVGIGTSAPDALFDVNTKANYTKGFLVQGDYDETNGAVPDLGAGSRMMFYPGKAAFRAGFATGTNWNNTNVGNYSTAFGFSNIASGLSSMAVGQNNIASGDLSVAMGSSVTATAFGEVGIGQYNTAGGGTATSWVATDNIFTIGNGSSTTNSNAFQVKKNGNTTIAGTLSVGDAINVNGNYTLPSTDGSSEQVLQTDGSGTLSWTTPASFIKAGVARDIGSIGANNSQFVDFNVTGAAIGDVVQVSPGADLPGGIIIGQAYVSAANTVRVKFRNTSGSSANPSTMTYYFVVMQ